MESDEGNAKILVDFLIATPYFQEIRESLRTYPDLVVPDPKQLVRNLDLEGMERYLDLLVVMDNERVTRDLYSKLKTPFKKDHPSNQDLELLLYESLRWVQDKFETLKTFRALCIQEKEQEHYARAISALTNAKDQTQVLEEFINSAGTSIPQKTSIGKTKKNIEEQYIENNLFAKKILPHVVIVGGFPKRKYAQLLEDHFTINKLSVLGPNPLNRLRRMGNSALYLCITNHMSHAAQYLLESQRCTIVLSPTSGSKKSPKHFLRI